jgi:hypothetical protein
VVLDCKLCHAPPRDKYRSHSHVDPFTIEPMPVYCSAGA